MPTTITMQGYARECVLNAPSTGNFGVMQGVVTQMLQLHLLTRLRLLTLLDIIAPIFSA